MIFRYVPTFSGTLEVSTNTTKTNADTGLSQVSGCEPDVSDLEIRWDDDIDNAGSPIINARSRLLIPVTSPEPIWIVLSRYESTNGWEGVDFEVTGGLQ